MTSATPWSVKGIDPKAREVAKDLARRSGMTLGEWLNRVILEDEGPEDLTSQDQFAQRPARNYFATPRTPGAPARFEAPEHAADELARVLAAVDRISDRIEAAETRTSVALNGVEQSVRETVARIEAGEREQVAIAARFEGAVQELGAGQSKLADRLHKYETDGSGPRSAEALHALEQALGKVAGHLYDGESRTREILGAVEARVKRLEAGGGDPALLADQVAGRLGARLAEAEAKTTNALEGLRASFAALDGRLKSVEGGSAPQAELRLSDLAASLTSRVEAARTEIAEKLRASADDRFDRMERKLGEMAQHVSVAEQRSARAIEEMGREVLSVADTLNRRVQTSEQRGAEAIQQVGGEMARIATAMETRLGRNENLHAEALERLGGEIARITERLGERIGAAERRSALAMDEVGEKLARVTDKLEQRHERASEDLAERIRQSEERTARILEEAREKIDQRLVEAQRRLAEPGANNARSVFTPFGAPAYEELGPPEPDRRVEPAFEAAPLAAFPAEPLAAEPAEPAFEDDFDAADDFDSDDGDTLTAAEPDLPEPASAAEEPEPEAFTRSQVVELDDDEPFFAETDFLRPSTAATAADEADPEPLVLGAADEDAEPAEAALPQPVAEDEDLFEPPLPPEPARPLTTREIVEQARAAARSTTAAGAGEKPKKGGATARPSVGALFSGFGAPRVKKRSGGAIQTALLVAGGAAFLSVGAAGLVVMGAKPGGAPPKRVADSVDAGQVPIAAAETDSSPFGPNPRAAIAITPQPIGASPTPAPAEDAGPALAAAYDSAVRAIEAQEPGAVEGLKQTANLGYAPAQLYLATLYENGRLGVKKDLAEARRWTERAAQGGDRKAMHNLALYAFEGVGGQPKNAPLAAQWFRRAADLGLVDSQYNLGRLYEQGLGVNQNPAEAYKWYLVAARSGDGESRQSAERVRGKLSADAQAVAQRAAAGYRSATATAAATSSPSVVIAQRALSRLGYYQGPRDGAVSPALNMAIAAYQREQGLPATGALDDTTVSKLVVFTR